MRKIGYSSTHWEGDKLFHGKKDTTISLVRDENFHDMFWVEWNFDKPMVSVNSYNITRAKDNARVLYMRYVNGDWND